MREKDSLADIEVFDVGGCCHADERGWVLFPWEAHDAPIDPGTLHVVHILPGATRGNHFHPRAHEWLCPLVGSGLLLWRPEGSAEVGELRLEERKFCVRIPPGVRHAVTNDGDGEIILVAARERDEGKDMTVREAVR